MLEFRYQYKNSLTFLRIAQYFTFFQFHLLSIYIVYVINYHETTIRFLLKHLTFLTFYVQTMYMQVLIYSIDFFKMMDKIINIS